MKIVCTDNYARETVADRLIADNIKSEPEAKTMVDALNAARYDSDWYVIKADADPLWRGMEELV